MEMNIYRWMGVLCWRRGVRNRPIWKETLKREWAEQQQLLRRDAARGNAGRKREEARLAGWSAFVTQNRTVYNTRARHKGIAQVAPVHPVQPPSARLIHSGSVEKFQDEGRLE